MSRPFQLTIFFALATLHAAPVFAQGVVIRAAAAGDGGTVETVETFAMPLEGLQSGMFSFGGEGMMLADPLSMLQQQPFADELTILEDQQKELKSLAREIRKMQSDVFSKFRQPGGKIDVKKIQELQGEMQAMRDAVKARTQAGLDKILLPAQRERLEEIRTQMQLRSGGISAVQNNRLAELIGLTDEQRKELVGKQGEYQKRLQKGIAELKAKLQQDILGEVLTKDQLKKLTAMQGERFQPKRTSLQEKLEQLRKSREESKDKEDK